MASIGTGYDQSCTTFSPDGRVFQVEYAQKAVDNSSTAVGIRCKDGVVMGVEKPKLSKMLVEGSNRRILTVDRHTGMCVSGLMADARQIVNFGRDEAANYLSQFGSPIPGEMLANRVADHMHYYTCFWYIRPFGAAVLVASYTEEGGPMLYAAEPSGVSYRFFATAIGKAKNACKSALEKLDLEKLTCREGARPPPRRPVATAALPPSTRFPRSPLLPASSRSGDRDCEDPDGAARPGEGQADRARALVGVRRHRPPAQARPSRAQGGGRRGGRGGARGDGRRLARRTSRP